MSKCGHCGKELTSGDVNGLCGSCSRLIHTPPTSYGWICPVCGRGNGPFVGTCPCIPLSKWEITCNVDNNREVTND